MKKAFLLTLLLPAFLGSCISVKHTAFEVKEPAHITLPPEVVNIILADNALVAPYEGEPEEGLITFDSIKVSFVEELQKQLTDAHFFGSVEIYPYEMRSDTAYWQELPLSAKDVTDICAETENDAVISVDNFFISMTTFPEQLPIEYASGVSMNIISKLRLYNMDGTELYVPLIFNDTLYWNKLDNNWNPIPFPSTKEMIEEGIEMASEVLVKQLTPYWSLQNRVYFAENDTEALITQNKWNEAFAIWEKAFETEKKGAKRARLAFDIALYYEYTDDIEKANEWMSTALDLLPASQSVNIHKHFDNYKETLEKRQVSRNKLKEQIGQ